MNKAVLILTLLLPLAFQATAQTGCTDAKADATSKSGPSDQARDSAPYDQSSPLTLLLAAESGVGFTPAPRQATAYAGVRVGGEHFALILGYDRLRGHDGFAMQYSGMIPIFRAPGPQKDESKNYLRVYAEPGIGYRAGGGGFGGYLSGGVMVALLSDKRLDSFRLSGLSPFIEYQRRAPFSAPGHGDNRFTFGLMLAVCAHCGLD